MSLYTCTTTIQKHASGTVWEPRTLEISWHCFSSNFVYNFNKASWFPLMWMFRFVTFVFTSICQGTNPCEQKWQIWTSTSTGTMVFCWSCKQSWSWTNAKKFLRFLGLMRSRSSNRILYRPANGREISSSLFGQTRRTRLYILNTSECMLLAKGKQIQS